MEELAGVADVIIAFGVLILMVALTCIIVELLQYRKSQKYRKEITDMYVAAKTRELAKDDKLDLEKEAETFKAWAKKKRLREREYDLDNTIEEELKEKIEEKKAKK